MRQNDAPGGAGLPEEISAALREWRERGAHCPRPDLLQAAQAGVLPPALSAPLLRHVESCGACEMLLQDLTQLDEVPPDAEQRQKIWTRIEASSGSAARRGNFRSWRARPWLAVALAAAVVIFIIAAGLLRDRPQPPSTVATAPVRPIHPVRPAPVLPLEKAPILLPPAALLVWRGQQEASPWNELQTALVSYQSGDYGKTSSLLEPLTVKYPQMAESWFYLGVCRLLLNANQGALSSLEKAHSLAEGPLADQAAWYLAIAYERTGRAADARGQLEKLCTGTGTDAARACSGLKALP